jgi:Catalytic LigB subunit of aromatic ring-opening dioxygenase
VGGLLQTDDYKRRNGGLMAEIVFGMAVPHSGMLGRPPEGWPEDGLRDRQKDELWYRNRTWTFPELAHERRGENFEALLTIEERTARSQRCTRALAEMRKAYEAAKPDVVVILGKDQKEVFLDMMPSFAVYTGEEIYNGPPQRSVYAPGEAVTHPGCPDLAVHIIRSLEKAGFDIADLIQWPPHSWLQNQKIVPHAYGFVYHQIMSDQAPPTVPILVNTFYPPTQPSMARCLRFGKALSEAIKSWPSDKRVAVIASGGLTHFVCDTELDKRFIGYLKAGDLEGLEAIDDRSYQSGTSEVKLYVPVLMAMKEVGAEMTLVDYVPCYRTEAGTGEGMGFMYWSPDPVAA